MSLGVGVSDPNAKGSTYFDTMASLNYGRFAIRTQRYRKEHNELALSPVSVCVKRMTNTEGDFQGFANQSWAAVHRSLSSAVLLGLESPRGAVVFVALC